MQNGVVIHSRIGDIATFKYYNLTTNDIPRFPVFLYIRRD
ncbi:MAG: hypothetical protein ACTTJS_01755 [Wolinella sp.]